MPLLPCKICRNPRDGVLFWSGRLMDICRSILSMDHTLHLTSWRTCHRNFNSVTSVSRAHTIPFDISAATSNHQSLVIAHFRNNQFPCTSEAIMSSNVGSSNLYADGDQVGMITTLSVPTTRLTHSSAPSQTTRPTRRRQSRDITRASPTLTLPTTQARRPRSPSLPVHC